MKFFTSVLAIAMVSCLPLISYADETELTEESFQTICVNSWMKRANEAKDQADYKNFGEKYCACAATQSLNNQEEIDRAIQVCMARTLLQDAMDSAKKDPGLDKATEANIGDFCQDKWNLVYPNMSERGKAASQAYCACAKSKLADIAKTSSNTATDKEYTEAINGVAASCSATLKAEAQQQTESQKPVETNRVE